MEHIRFYIKLFTHLLVLFLLIEFSCSRCKYYQLQANKNLKSARPATASEKDIARRCEKA